MAEKGRTARGRGLVRVLGTSFNVRSRSGRVSVDVEQGRVQVVTEPESLIFGTSVLQGHFLIAI